MTAPDKTPTTMRAWLYSNGTPGLENSLSLIESAPLPPWPPSKKNSNQALVKVSYASLNPIDYKLAEAGLIGRALVSVPATPGLDFSGVVAALPPNEEETEAKGGGFKVGDLVFGRIEPTKHGALGEYVVADREEGLAKLPSPASSSGANLRNLEAAACIGTAGLTAYQCIAPNVTEGGGDRVFINGGSGGTGTFAIQIAKALGCFVAASCSTANVELVKRLGADVVIDYKTQDVVGMLRELGGGGVGGGEGEGEGEKNGGGKKFKLVFDSVASPANLYKAADDFLDPAGGRFVQIAGGFTLADMKSMVSKALLPGFLGGGRRPYTFVMCKNKRAELERLGAWVAEGKIQVIIDGDEDAGSGDGGRDSSKAYDNAVVAYRKLKTGRAKGKVVVRMAKEGEEEGPVGAA